MVMKKVITLVVGFLSGFGVRNCLDYKRNIVEYEEKIVGLNTRVRRNTSIAEVYSKWLTIKQDGKSLVKYFEDNGYRSIAIYGMSRLGISLVRELEKSDIEIKYTIDRRAESIFGDIICVNPSQDLKKVDAVVVTPIFDYAEIEELLSNKLDCPIISIEDIVEYMK